MSRRKSRLEAASEQAVVWRQMQKAISQAIARSAAVIAVDIIGDGVAMGMMVGSWGFFGWATLDPNQAPPRITLTLS